MDLEPNVIVMTCEHKTDIEGHPDLEKKGEERVAMAHLRNRHPLMLNTMILEDTLWKAGANLVVVNPVFAWRVEQSCPVLPQF